MTWLIILISFGAGALVMAGLWWALSPDAVLKRQLTAESRRAGDVEGTEFSAFWDGR